MTVTILWLSSGVWIYQIVTGVTFSCRRAVDSSSYYCYHHYYHHYYRTTITRQPQTSARNTIVIHICEIPKPRCNCISSFFFLILSSQDRKRNILLSTQIAWWQIFLSVMIFMSWNQNWWIVVTFHVWYYQNIWYFRRDLYHTTWSVVYRTLMETTASSLVNCCSAMVWSDSPLRQQWMVRKCRAVKSWLFYVDRRTLFDRITERLSTDEGSSCIVIEFPVSRESAPKW